MSKITYENKVSGNEFTASNANEIKSSVNSAYDSIDALNATVSSINTTRATDAETLEGVDDVKIVTPSNALYAFTEWLSSIIISTLNTAAKTIKGAINELVSITIPFLVNFTGTITLENVGGKHYSDYTQSGALSVTVTPVGSIISGFAIIYIIVDGNMITVSGATRDPKSSYAGTVANGIDRYTFWRDAHGYWYSITNIS